MPCLVQYETAELGPSSPFGGDVSEGSRAPRASDLPGVSGLPPQGASLIPSPRESRAVSLVKAGGGVNPSHGLVVMVTVWGALYDQAPAPSFLTRVIIHGFVVLHWPCMAVILSP